MIYPICDVVIPIWNQPELTQRCLESILLSTDEPIRLILIDNGSGPQTRLALEKFQKQSPFPVQIIRNDTNLGFIKATNQGIRASQAEWVCFLNNDTVVTQGWLCEMLKVAREDPKIGLVNPTSNSLGFYLGKESLSTYAASLKSQSGSATELSTALGFCLLAKRSLFDSIGLLDETFGMGNFDDDDLSQRVRLGGYRCVRACAAYVYHEEKASFRNLPGWKKAFWENRRRFEQKWGRRLRILYSWIGPLPPEEPAIIQPLLELLGRGHWLTLLTPKDGFPQAVTSHAQVTCLTVPRNGWRLRATLRLLLKRKKPFDLVVSYDLLWSRWLHRLRWIHRAHLLHAPTTQEILKQCQTLSRCL